MKSIIFLLIALATLTTADARHPRGGYSVTIKVTHVFKNGVFGDAKVWKPVEKPGIKTVWKSVDAGFCFVGSRYRADWEKVSVGDELTVRARYNSKSKRIFDGVEKAFTYLCLIERNGYTRRRNDGAKR